ncbi:MAG: spermidine/putrescine ABC transporter permease PotC [Gammaproteobacteria bacterium]|nr:spermidine/putrescine ABC transporter permease PotC [Gammaproteobacteria bacterium]MBP9729202.1 spermidine/putrescine ABC transporter permease PotC [Gammaproteobacteria bacterium]
MFRMKRINGFYLLLIYLFLYAPIIVLIAYSFNDSPRSLLWHGFTTQWYKNLLNNTNLHVVAFNSLWVGLLAAMGATALGTLSAVCLYRYQFFGKRLLYALIFILIVSPDLVTGIALLILFSALKFPLGFWTLLLAHIAFCVPFVIVIIYARLSGYDKNIIEAAKDLGATDGVIFRKILVPLLWPAIMAGWLLSFTLSMDDVIISFFVTGPEFDILPLKIFSMLRLGVSPEVNALYGVLFVFTLLITGMYQALTWKTKP